jgi:Leucine-rich repeat (LRR) protein
MLLLKPLILVNLFAAGVTFVEVSQRDFLLESSSPYPNLPTIQFSALYDFYNATNGQYWQWDGYENIWDFSNPLANPCIEQWEGITCTYSNETNLFGILAMELTSHNLTGSIPSTLQQLANLTILALNYNHLYGEIPNEIGNLSNLQILDLESNNLNATIPDALYSLLQLQVLELERNDLSGTISSNVGKLYSLKEFEIGYNQFVSPLPNELFELPNLEILGLAANKFTGSILPFLNRMTNLTEFACEDNNFFGPIPENCFPPFLTTLGLMNNTFSGTLPLTLTLGNSLYSVAIYMNQFYGPFPANYYFQHFPNLTSLGIDVNFFTGAITIPREEEENIVLSDFYFDNNLFTGSLPNCTHSISEYLANTNYLTGSIGDKILKFHYFYYVGISENYLTGEINVQLALPYPEVTNFSYNLFEGNLLNVFDTSELSSLPETTELENGYISVNNNRLSGSFPENWTLPLFTQNLVMLDVSNNQITGLFPNSIRVSKIFSASTNCFHGSISKEFCELNNQTNLQYLYLNGMSSSSDCQQPLFPHTEITTFSPNYLFAQTIPECLFTIISLQELYLSGNGFTGTLPSSIMLSENLSTLVVSYNKLTGAFPNNFQNHNWSYLDLSYNFLKGELSSFDKNYSASDDVSLYLHVNHFSGIIPPSMTAIKNINILDGNMFTCNFNSNLLPKYDPEYRSYSCGSDAVNLNIYIWLAVITLFAMFVVYSLYLQANSSNRSSSSADTISYLEIITELPILCLKYYRYFHSYCSANDNNKNNIITFQAFNKKTILICVLLCGYMLIICFPTYCVLSAFYSSFEVKYAWYISPLFLSGIVPATVLSCEFLIFIWLAIFCFSRLYTRGRSSVNNEKQRNDSNERSFNSTRLSLLKICIYFLTGFSNLVVMILLDILYVFIVINYNTVIIFFTQVLISSLKILWNSYFLGNLLLFARNYVSRLANLSNNGAGNFTSRLISNGDVSFLSLNLSLNNLIYPITAITILSTDCFHNAFFQANAVSFNAIVATDEFSDGGAVPISVSSSYYPMFSYGYQCSSIIYSYYCPIFIIMLLSESIVMPAIYLVLLLKENATKTENRVLSSTGIELSSVGSSDKDGSSRQYRIHSLTDSLKNSRLAKSFVVNIRGDDKRILFNRKRYIMRLGAFFLIFIAYGSIFPPLAVISIFSILAKLFVEEITIGFMLFIAETDGIPIIEETLKSNCDGIFETMDSCYFGVLPISMLLFGYLVFDIFGEVVNPSTASIPLVVFTGCWIIFLISSIKFPSKSDEHSSVESITIENPVQATTNIST